LILQKPSRSSCDSSRQERLDGHRHQHRAAGRRHRAPSGAATDSSQGYVRADQQADGQRRSPVIGDRPAERMLSIAKRHLQPTDVSVLRLFGGVAGAYQPAGVGRGATRSLRARTLWPQTRPVARHAFGSGGLTPQHNRSMPFGEIVAVTP
jgi:hypothetical protein